MKRRSWIARTVIASGPEELAYGVVLLAIGVMFGVLFALIPGGLDFAGGFTAAVLGRLVWDIGVFLWLTRHRWRQSGEERER